MLSLMLNHLELEKEKELGFVEKLSLQRKAIFLIESMAKNRNEETPMLGLSKIDLEKHRVLSNEIDLELFYKTEQLKGKEFFVSSVSIEALELKETRQFEEAGQECISLDRIVLVEGKTGKLEATICER